MAEWFRGIAVGGPAARAEQVNDLGAGVYFTDTLEVAQQYSKFRSDRANTSPDATRTSRPAVLYGDFGSELLGNVLDLTSGPQGQAWAEYEQAASFSGTTNRDIMKMGPQQYGPMFRQWAQSRGLNLNSYSAIVGPEYTNGGKQLCIRNPQVADRATAQMVGRSTYAPPPPLPASAIPSLTYTVKGQANAAAMVAVFMIVDSFQANLNAYFQEGWVRQAVAADTRTVREWQKRNPGDGALIVTTFKRVVVNSEFMQNKVMIQPGDAFEFNSIFFAPTPAAAATEMARTQELVQGDTVDGPYRTIRRKQAVWIPPLEAQAEDDTTTLPGRWQVSIAGWKGVFGFKPGGECYWKEGSEPAHAGTWKQVGNEVQWTYADDPPGWERVFHAATPLKKKTSGPATIKGLNHGYYTMVKSG